MCFGLSRLLIRKSSKEDSAMQHLSLDERQQLGDLFEDLLPYFEFRITFLNRRACLYPNEPCGKRARQEITGILSVLNALGYEAYGNWEDFNCKFSLMPCCDVHKINELKAKEESEGTANK